MKTRLTKAHKAALLAKLLPCIDTSEYEGASLYSIFTREKSCFLSKMQQVQVFEDWLRGLPTCCTIPYWDYEALDIWHSLGVVGHDVDSYWYHAAVVLLAHAKSI